MLQGFGLSGPREARRDKGTHLQGRAGGSCSFLESRMATLRDVVTLWYSVLVISKVCVLAPYCLRANAVCTGGARDTQVRKVT